MSKFLLDMVISPPEEGLPWGAFPARRTAEYNVEDAWKVLFKAKTPDEIARSGILQEARDKVNREVERCTHTAPKFSMDGRVALLRIDSGFQGKRRYPMNCKASELYLLVSFHYQYIPS